MQTIVRAAEATLSVRRSRFLASAWIARTTEQFHQTLDEIARGHHSARHIAYAYRLRAEGEERAHDAGEPAGSAGTPILQLLQGEELWDVGVAVVRYFGGVKLGVGNLARAYREAARAALAGAGMRPLVPTTRAVVLAPPELLGEVFAVLGRQRVQVLGQRVEEQAEVRVEVAERDLEALGEAMTPWAQVRVEEG